MTARTGIGVDLGTITRHVTDPSQPEPAGIILVEETNQTTNDTVSRFEETLVLRCPNG